MTESPSRRSYHGLFGGGQWRKPADPQQLAVISPHTEGPIGHVQMPGPRRRWPLPASIHGRHIDETADLITAEMGSPRSFSRLGQVAGAATMMHPTLAVARQFR
jgi:hypothetical protein